MTQPGTVEAAKSLIRKSVKRVCPIASCNHISCNRSAFGGVNEPHKPVVAVLLDAFKASECSTWVDLIETANQELEAKYAAAERVGKMYP